MACCKMSVLIHTFKLDASEAGGGATRWKTSALYLSFLGPHLLKSPAVSFDLKPLMHSHFNEENTLPYTMSALDLSQWCE